MIFRSEHTGILVQKSPNFVFFSSKKYSVCGQYNAKAPISTMLILREELSPFCVMVALITFHCIFGYEMYSYDSIP